MIPCREILKVRAVKVVRPGREIGGGSNVRPDRFRNEEKRAERHKNEEMRQAMRL